MNRNELRQHIETLELQHDVMTAIDDLSGAELEREAVKLAIADQDELLAASIYRLPRALMLLGLRAMRDELQARIEAQSGVTA